MKPRNTVTIAALLACGLATPLTAHAVELTETGRRVFEEIAGIGCATCHGQFAEGDLGIGPYIRGASDGTIRAAIDGVTEMIVIKNVISEKEISAVAAYLRDLGSTQVARTLVKRGRFIPETISVRPGMSLQVIINNAGFAAASFVSEDMEIAELSIPGRETASFVWQAPDADDTFSLSCIDCKLKDQFFSINVDSNAPEFKGLVQAAQ